MSVRIEYLADHPEALPVLQVWFETEWATYYGPGGPGNAEQDLLAYTPSLGNGKDSITQRDRRPIKKRPTLDTRQVSKILS